VVHAHIELELFLLKTFKALNGLLCADVPLRNYSLTHPISKCLCAYVQEHKTIAGFPGASAYEGASLLEEDCDILCPCAIPAVITEQNAPRIKARIIAEGANGPITYDAHQILLNRNVRSSYCLWLRS